MSISIVRGDAALILTDTIGVVGVVGISTGIIDVTVDSFSFLLVDRWLPVVAVILKNDLIHQ